MTHRPGCCVDPIATDRIPCADGKFRSCPRISHLLEYRERDDLFFSGFFMRNARRILRSSTLWGMIPLALWAGLPATGCFCADGSFKPFCTGHLAVTPGKNFADSNLAAARALRATQPRCPACAAAMEDPSDDFAPLGGSPTACCQLSESTTVTLTPVLSMPDFAKFGGTVVVPVVIMPRFSVAQFASSHDVSETGPPVDRVIVNCSLLI